MTSTNLDSLGDSSVAKADRDGDTTNTDHTKKFTITELRRGLILVCVTKLKLVVFLLMICGSCSILFVSVRVVVGLQDFFVVCSCYC